MLYHLTLKSGNQKVGPIAVATVAKSSCPTSCLLRDGGGCYAESGPLAIHWKKITQGQRGVEFADFLKLVEDLPDKIWRYAQAGDLPGEGDNIDAEQLRQLVVANDNRPVLAYTHKPLTPENRLAISSAGNGGFHINVSCDSVESVDAVVEQGFSAVTVLPLEYQRGSTESLQDYRERARNLPQTTPGGTPIAVCPATYVDTNCLKCGACSRPRKQNTVIGFPAHGSQKRKVDRRLKSGTNIEGPS